MPWVREVSGLVVFEEEREGWTLVVMSQPDHDKGIGVTAHRLTHTPNTELSFARLDYSDSDRR